MKTIVFLLLLTGLFLVTGSVVMAEDHIGPKDVVFQTTIGTITFQHFQHQGKISDCTECHHMGIEKGKCTDCHGVDKAIPRLTTAFHGQCKGCHRNSSGPISCKGCHVKN